MYKLLIDEKQWKDCLNTSEEDVRYIAKTLSKFSHCKVDVYKSIRSSSFQVISFNRGKFVRTEVVA